MIRSFGGEDTAAVWRRERPRRIPPDVRPRALRKLRMVDAAQRIEDLRIPPGNRLEKLAGDLAGSWSIRINDQWRIVFQWDGRDAHEVTVTDYH